MSDVHAPEPQGRPNAGRRKADRRGSMSALAESLSALLLTPVNPPHMLSAAEACVRDIFSGADARIRRVDSPSDSPPLPLLRPESTPSAAEHRILIPMRPGSARYALELVPQRRSLDAWDRQMLETAGRLVGLALEIARLRGLWPGRPVSRASRATAGPSRLIGVSSSIRRLQDTIARVAPTDSTVVLQGESGTGKELIAREIHEQSRRRRGPLVAVNCAALVETLVEAELFGIEDRTATGVRGRRGKFEHADGGTLFLDEVVDLSPAAQAKLLRVLQDLAVERVGGHGARTVDVRIIAASNRRLYEEVQQHRFREDLFYRLAGIEILVPPLRERREDILILAEHFLELLRGDRRLTLAPSAIDAMCSYAWPGNVRELERVIEAAAVLARTDTIQAADLPPQVSARSAEVLVPSVDAEESLRSWARRYVRMTLERSENNKRQACRILQISYHTLQAYLGHDSRRGARRPAAAPPKLHPSTASAAVRAPLRL